jgi:hypothetical protein
MNQELLRALQRLPRGGHIREATTLAWGLRFARQAPLDDGGRRIVLGTDRPMLFWEIRDRPRSFDYPFTVIEMHLNKENRGEGKLLADTRIFIDPRTNDLGAGALRHPAGAPQSNQAAAQSAIVAESVGSTAERLVFESPRPPSSAKTPSQPVKCAGGGGTREASRARRARNRQDADVRQDADSPSRL